MSRLHIAITVVALLVIGAVVTLARLGVDNLTRLVVRS